MTLLGLDVGERRIGVAVGDTISGSVRPLRTIARATPERDAATLVRIAAETGASELVIGLPLDARGGTGPQAALTLAWAAVVGPIVGLPIAWRDERHSSITAEARMGRAPRGSGGGPPSPAARRAWRARIDREAACVILQAEVDARARVTP